LEKDLVAALPDDALLALARRGAVVESVHRGRAVFCDPAGSVLDAVGDPAGYVYVRSSVKPFQALPLVLSGAAAAFGLTDEELAVVCASHSAEEYQLAAVRSVLDKAGLSEEYLQSGPHRPRSAATAAKLARDGEEPRPIHGNCSGKHAGMLAVCAHEGWSLRDYRRPDHPLQRWILTLLAEVCGLEEDEILLGGDGCGVPSFAMPLASLATGFARFATGPELPAEVAGACGRLWRAMRGHPGMIAGPGRLDTQLMEGTGLVAKRGAEGVFAAGSPEGWGMALKVSDGAARGARPAVLSLLARNRVAYPEELETYEIKDLHGEAVGEMVPVVE
jgi:L-asparaginase II